MKNIHILPTDKSSRLSIKDGILILHRLQWRKGTHHIYITSDEEIKMGDWVHCKDDNTVIQLKTNLSVMLANSQKEKYGFKTFYKIILTTDADLINDGVQAIEDDFLEWFVKNPSCESVEVLKQGVKTKRNQWGFTWKYFIKIPKEEPKQETLEEANFKVLGTKTDTFYNGAKWQQERMYSEEEVLRLLVKRELFLELYDMANEYEDANEWFEQFKKK